MGLEREQETVPKLANSIIFQSAWVTCNPDFKIIINNLNGIRQNYSYNDRPTASRMIYRTAPIYFDI